MQVFLKLIQTNPAQFIHWPGMSAIDQENVGGWKMPADYGALIDIFAVLKKARLRIMKEISSKNENLGITDISVFSKVFRRDEGLTMSELSDATTFSNAIITSAVDHLERIGLVKRKRGEDRRTYHIVPTEEGIEKFRELKTHEDMALSSIFDGMPEEEKRRLYEIISELKEILDRYI